MKKIKNRIMWWHILIGIIILVLLFILIYFIILIKSCACDNGEGFKLLLDNIKREGMRDSDIFDKKDGSGIILVAGGEKYGKLALDNVKSFRGKGSVLPVEIFYIGDDELNNRWMKELSGMKDIKLSNIYDYYDLRKIVFPKNGLGCILSAYSTKRGHGFATKALALKYSRFRHIILLDADNVCLDNPDKLLESPYYKEYGAILWRDMHDDFSEKMNINMGPVNVIKMKTVGKLLNDISKHSNEDALKKMGWSSSLPQICSAQLVMDTVRHKKGVDFISNLNENAETVYASFWGDKDTYAFGLMLADEKYYVVPDKPLFMGKEINDVFSGHSFIQVSPDDNSYLFKHRNSEKGHSDQYNKLPDVIKKASKFQSPVINDLGRLGYDYMDDQKGGYHNLKNFNKKMMLPLNKLLKRW